MGGSSSKDILLESVDKLKTEDISFRDLEFWKTLWTANLSNKVFLNSTAIYLFQF